ncbi:ABC transporter permease [Ktedonosporobacter rubrisoli]|uniref:ABC transporter permease n=1 Tax=Ktedonosporobacter rubrisoli TaxID=2509675 RepID=A0A4P6K1W1_KTERU|nr:ABC transporter permease [Ktedonosporobacter rubrisoli]QBD81823.1 ABC transporter permease [Ktedonosporobacter rubrisoli]
MTFLALLTKELRLRMRRERTIWVIVVYILLMGLLGWFFITRFTDNNSYYGSNGWSDAGRNLYVLLSLLQLFLIVFITPAFTATAVNGEKERQTYDLLLCSRLSAFALVCGKLVAGLMNALLLIAASAPLFSLVFFFGGVAPDQVLSALLIFVDTAFVIGTLGLLCSTLFQRPAVSTAITYLLSLLWIVMPLLIFFIRTLGDVGGGSSMKGYPWSLAWNPAIALYSTFSMGSLGGVNAFLVGSMQIAPWVVFSLLSVLGTAILFLLSMWTAKPNALARFRTWRKGKDTQAAASAL